jgi:hypothetical protein
MELDAVPAVKTTPDGFPSGSWSFGPISVAWSLRNDNEVDVTLSILGIQVDTLSGTITSNDASLSDNVNILGIVKGTLTIEADYAAGSTTNGLYIKGSISGPGFNVPNFSYRIIAW